jgi:hypothetical protein
MSVKKSKYVRVSDIESVRNLEYYFKSEGCSKEEIGNILGVTYNTWRFHLRSIVIGNAITYDFAKLVDKALADKGFDLYYMSGRMEPEEVKSILEENFELKKKVQQLESEIKKRKD